MSISVEIALKLPEMKDVSVVAGAAGLRREISSVNVMEVPDIANYLKPGVLLITTMYSIRNDEDIQRKLIPLLVDKGATALALAPLHKNGGIRTNIKGIYCVLGINNHGKLPISRFVIDKINFPLIY
jgi:hypothetical protein